MRKYKPFLIFSILVVFLAIGTSGCITIVSQKPVQTGSLPVINSFNGYAINITSGDSSELRWNVSNADSVSISPSIGNVELVDSVFVSPTSDTKYILTATNEYGSVTAELNISVEQPLSPVIINYPPLINYFKAEPGVIPAGNAIVLNWSVSDATSISISPLVGSVASSGSFTIIPQNSVLFTLSASNKHGNTIATAQVIVTEPSTSIIYIGLPVINSFVAQPAIINVGQSVVLSWNVLNASTVTVDQGIGAVSPAGSVQVSPSQTTTYILQAINSNGISTASISVIVNSSVVGLNWTGDYDTDWGRMHLEQVGNAVNGTYTYQDGRIEATISSVNPYVINGRWMESPSYAPAHDAGDVYLTISSDYSTISGKWRYGYTGDFSPTGSWNGTWNGHRIIP